MKRFGILLLILICVSIASAQSGRRITTNPEPTPVIVDENSYSESRSYKPQIIYPPNYRDKNSRKKKEEKKIIKIADEDVDEDIINVDSTLVTIPISVFNRNGLYISGIKKEEIKIFEDGKEQEVAFFGISEKPFTVALLIDTSPSTEYKIEEIRRAAKAFVDELQPQDKVIVIEFDGDPQVLAEATNDRQKIYRGIDKADFGQGTALYDAVDFTLNKRLNKIEGRKAIVLFTDGVDTVSRRSYGSTMRDAEESESIIFPIYYNTFLGNSGITGGGISGGGGINGGMIPSIGGTQNRGYGNTAEEYALGKRYLDELAAFTGGRVFIPEKTPGGLQSAFEGIAEELRRQYNIGYYPADEGKIGQRKQIKVRVYRPKLIVRARDSYIVGSNQQ
ncbi:MAG: VWA domain-containing protein [Acidobacteriota bacterium]|nr:VWA domain-containing protein [Acidobacteriota bacterium]